MIKTTQEKSVIAYGAIGRIRQKVKGRNALNLFHMKNILQENIDFQIEQEKALVEEYEGILSDGGTVLFNDADKRAAFQEAYKELQATECEVDADPITMSIETIPDITLEDIEQLNGFIIFM